MVVNYSVQQLDTRTGEQFLDGHAKRIGDIVAHRLGGPSHALRSSVRRAARA